MPALCLQIACNPPLCISGVATNCVTEKRGGTESPIFNQVWRLRGGGGKVHVERVKRGDKPLVWLHIPHDQGLLGWYGFLKKLELLEWTLMEVVQLVC